MSPDTLSSHKVDLVFFPLLILASKGEERIKPICEGRSRLVLMKEESWMSYCTFIECRIEALLEGSIEACCNTILGLY